MRHPHLYAEESHLESLSDDGLEDLKFLNQESLGTIYNLISLHPDKRVDKIFRLRYNGGKGNKLMSWKEVSKEVNLSIQGCINVHNSAIRHIQTKLQKDKA